MKSGRMSEQEVYEIVQECKDNIDKVAKLYLETDPSRGKVSEKDKYSKAVMAISMANSRVGILTQWAESHIIGYYQNCSTNHESNINSHLHESFDDEKDICAYRDAIGSILDKLTPSMMVGHSSPSFHNWRVHLMESLFAINQGEVFDLLEPKKFKKQKNKYTLEKLRTAAVLHVYRLWHYYERKHIALKIVSEKICLDAETILHWEKTLLKQKDSDKSHRQSIREGAKAWEELKKKIHDLKLRELEQSEFFREYNKLHIAYDKESPALSNHQMLIWEFPLEYLGDWLREQK